MPSPSAVGRLPELRAVLRDSLSGALSLVFPTWCAGCDAPDTDLCASCRSLLAPEVRGRTVGGLDVRSALDFDGVAARVLRAAKEEGRTGLLRALAPALDAAVRAALVRVPDGAVALVPVPTSAAAMRRRGYRVVELLASQACLPTHRLLRVEGRAVDQRGLGRSERARNIAGRMRARGVEGRSVLIIDDVVTTGATLREAARALEAARAIVVGAATVASTALHIPRKGFVTATDR